MLDTGGNERQALTGSNFSDLGQILQSIAHPSRHPPSMEVTKNGLTVEAIQLHRLPARRVVVATQPEAVPIYLQAKKRAIEAAPPPESTVPVCLPAKTRMGEPQQPPDVVASRRILAKKRVQAPSLEDADDGFVPVCPPANCRVCTVPAADTATSTYVVAKNRILVSGPLQDAMRFVPMCLPGYRPTST